MRSAGWPRSSRHAGIPRSTRPRWPRSATTRSASRATASTAPGSPIPTSSRWRPRSSTACWARTPTRRRARGRRSPSRPPQLLDLRVDGGQVTEAGVRTNVSVALQYLDSWLLRQRRRRDQQPDGGRRDRRDLPLAALAVAGHPDAPRRRPRSSTATSTRASATTSSAVSAAPRSAASATPSRSSTSSSSRTASRTSSRSRPTASWTEFRSARARVPPAPGLFPGRMSPTTGALRPLCSCTGRIVPTDGGPERSRSCPARMKSPRGPADPSNSFTGGIPGRPGAGRLSSR